MIRSTRSTRSPVGRMPKLAEPPLAPFLADVGCEFEDASQRHGVVDRFLRLGSCGVRLRIVGASLADVLLPALARVCVPGLESVDATVVSWSQRSTAGRSVRWPWAAGDIGPGGLVRGSEPAGLAVVHETYSDAVTVVNWAERLVLYRVPASDRVAWWERAAPLRVALFWALNGPCRHLVHAGGVGDSRGAVVLAGARRSGKTTVALAALASGFRYLGDDYLLLDAAGEPKVSPIYNTASVRPAAASDAKEVLDLSARCLIPRALLADSRGHRSEGS